MVWKSILALRDMQFYIDVIAWTDVIQHQVNGAMKTERNNASRDAIWLYNKFDRTFELANASFNLKGRK